MRLAHEFGLWARPGVTVAAPARATDAELLTRTTATGCGPVL
jgi:hypothetical protein